MTRIKVCGLTNREDGLLAAELGAHALGFIFAPSPRRVSPEQAQEIIHHLPPLIHKVGVFVDAPLEEVKRIMALCPLNVAQLHGQESPEYCASLYPQVIKAFSVTDMGVLELLPRYRAMAYLLDSYSPSQAGGTGKAFDWGIAQQATHVGRVILSGGLTPENVAEAIALVHPFGVDVGSGVEAWPGKKDPRKLQEFFKAVREADETAR